MNTTPTTEFRIVRNHHNIDPDGSWAWHLVCDFKGTLALDENGNISEAQEIELLNWIDRTIYTVRPEGTGGPGQHFAHAPWIQWFNGWAIVSQNGGRDI